MEFIKKKRSSLEISPTFNSFAPKFVVYSKKKGLYSKSFQDFLILLQISYSSLKKVSSPEISPSFSAFCPKIGVISKKGLRLKPSHLSLISSQISDVPYYVQK